MRHKVIAVFLISILFYPVSALPFCFAEAGKQYGVDPVYPYLITKVESNFNPVAIHYNEDGSYDFGAMQINSRWAKVLGPEVWQSLGDPCTNVKVGTWILSDCLRRYGNTWGAIGCYNAASPEKRVIYIKKVRTELERLMNRRKRDIDNRNNLNN